MLKSYCYIVINYYIGFKTSDRLIRVEIFAGKTNINYCIK